MSVASEAGGPPEDHEDRALSAEIREHLARKLRAEYSLEAEKPAFLGDTALPPHLDRYVRKLESMDRSSEAGLEAIRREFGVREDDDPGPAA